jgi:hypothetical protein
LLLRMPLRVSSRGLGSGFLMLLLSITLLVSMLERELLHGLDMLSVRHFSCLLLGADALLLLLFALPSARPLRGCPSALYVQASMKLLLSPALLEEILTSGSHEFAVSLALLNNSLVPSQQGVPVTSPLAECRTLALMDKSQGIAMLLMRKQMFACKVGKFQRQSIHQHFSPSSLKLPLYAHEAEVSLVIPARAPLPQICGLSFQTRKFSRNLFVKIAKLVLIDLGRRKSGYSIEKRILLIAKSSSVLSQRWALARPNTVGHKLSSKGPQHL